MITECFIYKVLQMSETFNLGEVFLITASDGTIGY